MPYKLDRDKIQAIILESMQQAESLFEKRFVGKLTVDELDEDILSTASQAADDIMDMSNHDEDLTIEIHVDGGCVTDVEGLPDGWGYVIDDHDAGEISDRMIN